MSGVEVVGALAAGCQLVAYIIQATEALIKLHEHVKHASLRFRTYSDQLASLSATLLFFKENPHLLSTICEALVRSISDRVDGINHILDRCLSKASRSPIKKYLRVVSERKAERHIREDFRALEQFKNDLILSMAGSNRKALEEFRAAFLQRLAELPLKKDPATSLEEIIEKDKQIVPYRNRTEDDQESNMSSASSRTRTPDREDRAESVEPANVELENRFVNARQQNLAVQCIGAGARKGYFEACEQSWGALGLIGPVHGEDLKNVLQYASPAQTRS